MRKTMKATVHGKILLSGGYSILYDDNVGIALSVDSAYYMIISTHKREAFIIRNCNTKVDNYEVEFASIGESYKQITKNKIINACSYVLYQFFRANNIHLPGLLCEVKFDGHFYGVEGSVDQIYADNLSCLRKTGLGSSSCFIVLLIGSVYCYCTGRSPENALYEIYLLSIIANSIAQGKIGSNYDIYTCIFGNNKFVKLPSAAISKLIEIFQTSGKIIIDKYTALEKSVCMTDVGYFKNSYIYLIDSAKGYDTVKSCKGVISYFDTHVQHKETYAKIMNEIADKMFQIGYDELFELNLKQRMAQQKLSRDSELPIEPEEYSIYLDIIMYEFKERLVYCICPGAGGYDGFVVISRVPIGSELQNCLDHIYEHGYKEKLAQAREDLKSKYEYINMLNESQTGGILDLRLRVIALNTSPCGGMTIEHNN